MNSQAEALQYCGDWPDEGLERVPNCPICGSSLRTTLYEGLTDIVFRVAPGAWCLQGCEACDTAYLDPRPTPETISLAYRSYYTHDAGNPAPAGMGFADRLAQILRNGYLNAKYGYAFTPASRLGQLVIPLFPLRRLRANRQVRELPHHTGGRILDVGCGNGAFLSGLRDQGWEVHGVDPDPEAAAVARRLGIEIVEGQLERGAFPDEHFDVITMNHVIEHLHNPVEVLRVCRSMLKPGGTLWLSTPNIASRGHRAFRSHWIGLDPPRHLVLMNPNSLRRACEAAGLQVVKVTETPLAGPYFHRVSAALARGEGLTAQAPRYAQSTRLAAFAADLATLLHIQQGDEIALTATRGS